MVFITLFEKRAILAAESISFDLISEDSGDSDRIANVIRVGDRLYYVNKKNENFLRLRAYIRKRNAKQSGKS